MSKWEEFVEKPKIRAPLINWGYYIRKKSLELTLERAVAYYTAKDRPFQILSIGAGFDTTYFTISRTFRPAKMTFFEIDLPSNVNRKVQLIRKSEKCGFATDLVSKFLVSASIDHNVLISDKYKLFSCDLSDIDGLKRTLTKQRFDFSLPTLILSECVITYMKV